MRLADHLVGKSVERVNPDLVARLWLLGAFLGKKITVTSGHRSDEEQTRIWDSGVRPAARPVSRGGGGSNHTRGQAVDATIDGEPIATAVGRAPCGSSD